MKSIVAVLQDFEKIVYKILMWIILIPKTIIQVIIDPISFREYVQGEADDTSPFDEYISPVILLLVVAFLPAIAYNSLPVFGSVIHSPAETEPVTGRYVSFESLTDFKANATESSAYIHTWVVSKENDDGGLEPVDTQAHREDNEFARNLERVDKDTVTDRFVYKFEGPGDYYVVVNAEKIDAAHKNKPTEKYSSSVLVTIPPRDSEPVTISSTNSNTNTTTHGAKKPGTFAERIKQEETIFLALALMIPPLLFAFASRFFLNKSKVTDDGKKDAEVTDKNPTKPAGGDKTVTSDTSGLSAWWSKYVPIGEETLKNQFYVQCYYFSPLSLAIWVTIYASYFFTDDVFLYQSEGLYWQIMFLPLVLCVMWFLRTEVRYLAEERKISELPAGTIAILCIVLLGVGANIIFRFDKFRDALRVWTIRAFPMIAILLMVAFFSAWFGRRMKKKDFRQSGALIVVVVILFFAIMGMIPNLINLAVPSASVVVGQAQRTTVPSEQASAVEPASTATLESVGAATTQIPVQATATSILNLFTATTNPDQTLLTAIVEQFTPTAVPLQPTPTLVMPTSTPAPSPFYMEAFDNELASWFDFMTSGDLGMVIKNLEAGKLVIQLLEKDDKLPWYYLIRDGYSYSNVTVEAVVVNQGNNTNGVSLICRYSDIGWYEFVVSNSGFYQIYAVDNAGVMNQGYNLIADGGSSAIKSGPGAVNTYTITCEGDKLELKVNGNQVRTLPEKNFNFPDGLIGLAVSSPNKIPVWVEFESLTVSQPK